MKKTLLFVPLVIAALLSACTGAPPASAEPQPFPVETFQPIEPAPGASDGSQSMNEYAPQPNDANWTRSDAKVTSAELLVTTPPGLGGVPPLVTLNLQGELPSPCHQLRIASSQPDTNNTIKVEVYSVLDPSVSCPDTPMPFQATYQFDFFPAGSYSVEANGESAGTFDIPEISGATPGGIISTTPGGEATPGGPVAVTPGGSATDAPRIYDPQPGDAKLQRDTVYIDSFESVQLQSYPPQTTLTIKGNLPTPCHQLRVKVNPPDSKNKIVIDVYSLSNPDTMCIQVLAPFEVGVNLGSYPTGHYTIWVNGEQVGEFDS